ncbi:MAG TPA: phosphate ABC transporter permease PstA [Kiritimatiellia bacterium]|nr:phosphate ABC transporter permease PstA [Kiritimatiellia bacterium]HMP35405.1 phosphate ABC transporter permease PstA [Kiritimatiellia bacterium]
MISHFPDGSDEQRHRKRRQNRGRRWQALFLCSTLVAIVALSALLYNVINSSFGLVAVKEQVPAEELAIDGTELADMDAPQLVGILENRLSKGLIRRFNHEAPLIERSPDELRSLIDERIIKPTIIKTYTLVDTVRDNRRIRAEWAEKDASVTVRFRAWVHKDFLTSSQSSDPNKAGIRTAIIGSLMIILFTVSFAFPIGVGAAIYLEEYADNTIFNRIIKTNISNLAGVPSIIYGMLGLALFVRMLEPLTSGALFGLTDPTTANGRTILAASLTLALLILPMIIINGQEAIRAVPNSLREASYGVGATKWQTIWNHVLPKSMPGILTGTILAVSRAIGETAPLVVVGASTFIAVDPSGPFSKFTTLPVQIYQWTSRPQPEFRHIAAAAIVVLLVLLLSMNAFAIIMRNRYRKQS